MTSPYDIPAACTALDFCDSLGLDLSKMTADDLYSRLRAELIDQDVRETEADYSNAEW